MYAIVGEYPEGFENFGPDDRDDVKVLDMDLETRQEAKDKIADLELEGYRDLHIWEYNPL